MRKFLDNFSGCHAAAATSALEITSAETVNRFAAISATRLYATRATRKSTATLPMDVVPVLKNAVVVFATFVLIVH